MKQSYKIRTLSIVFLIVGVYENAFAQGKKPNIVILATGGTIAGAADCTTWSRGRLDRG